MTSWLGQLSEKQTVAVAPFLKALSDLMSEQKSVGEQGANEPSSTLGVASSSPISAAPLEFIDQILTEALGLSDPQEIKDSISKCLDIVRTEKVKPRPSPAAAPATSSALPVDAETGLPGRLMFEKLVNDSIAEGRNFISALFVVERLPLINKRFGRIAGDRVLLYVAQYLAQELPDSNSLSRWSGPAFSTIINSENSDKMESQIRAISNKPLSANIDVGNRSVMLTISCACMIEQLSVRDSSEELFNKMDQFVQLKMSS